MSIANSVQTLRNDEELTIEQKEALLGYALVIPSLLLIFGVILYPVLYNIYLSLHQVPVNPTSPLEWVGLGHYQTLLTSDEFWFALKNTIIFTLFSSVLATAGGLAVALLFRRQFRGRRYIRGLMLLPYVAPLISIAYIWQWLLDPLYGLIPYLFSDVLSLYSGSIDLLNSEATALWTVILIDMWRFFPFAFLLIIARVYAIPKDMYEAAKIDGAGILAQFKDITLPELKYVVATVFLLRWIWNFNTFANIWLLTHQVKTLSIFAYQTAFASYQQGLAAAIAVIMFLGLMLFVTVYVTWIIEW